MMKKSLIALAAATVAGAAFAQSSVSITGVVDIGYGQVDGSGGTTALTQQGANRLDQQRVAQNGSATTSINISGSEDIGGGLRGIFRYEMNPDFVAGTGLTSAATGGVHQTFVGLTGNFGEVRLGRINSAFLQNWGIVSQFGTNLGSGFGGAGVLTRYTSTVPATSAPTRFGNAIEYQSPVFNGIQGRLMYVPEDNDGVDTLRPGVVDAGLRFAQGPISAMLSWQQTQASRAVTATASPIGVAGTDVESTLWMLGARYTMGALVFSGGYWQEQVEVAGVERADIRGWSLGARYTMGPWALIAMYTQSEDDAAAPIFNSAGSATTLETGANRSVLGLGADYSFSKRTALYGRFEGRDMGPTEVQTIHVGIRHTF